MHNGCTTAIETIVSKIVLTYVTFEQKRMLGANKVGIRVETPNELLDKANKLFNSFISNTKNNDNNITDYVSQLIYFDKNELAAEKIIKVWESFSNKSLSNFQI